MKLVVLDRDGVINQDSKTYIKSVDEWLPIDGSIDAIASLSNTGYSVVIATNQSGLGRKLFDEYALAQIHHNLCSMVEEAGGMIDGIFYCPHIPEDRCQCRKPGVGLLRQIEQEFACSRAGSYFVGDSYRDIQAALRFDCNPVLVKTGNGIETEKVLKCEGLDSVPVFADLAEAVRQLLANENA